MPDVNKLQRDLNHLLKGTMRESDEVILLKDGAELLPDYASVEPGALLYETYEVWKRLASGHTFNHLHETLKKLNKPQEPIQSLQHKLRGRLSITLPEAEDLLRAMFTDWSGPRRRFLQRDPKGTAKEVAAVLFGPIFGQERQEIRIAESPGINAGRFMGRQRRAKARAIVFPVIEQAMYGDSPTSSLYGSLLTLLQLLGRTESEHKRKQPDDQPEVPHIVYALRSKRDDDGEDYARYLYERSLLSALFALVRVAAAKEWKLMHHADARIAQFPCWAEPAENSLAKRMSVWILPSEKGTDIVPYTVPERWRRDVMPGGFEKWGFLAVRKQNGDLSFWKFRKSDRAFSAIPSEDRVQRGSPMVAAYRALIDAVENNERTSETVPGECWSADDFIGGKDLAVLEAKSAATVAGQGDQPWQ